MNKDKLSLLYVRDENGAITNVLFQMPIDLLEHALATARSLEPAPEEASAPYRKGFTIVHAEAYQKEE